MHNCYQICQVFNNDNDLRIAEKRFLEMYSFFNFYKCFNNRLDQGWMKYRQLRFERVY